MVCIYVIMIPKINIVQFQSQRSISVVSLDCWLRSTLPMMITEYGADAYDNSNQREWQNDEQHLGADGSNREESQSRMRLSSRKHTVICLAAYQL